MGVLTTECGGGVTYEWNAEHSPIGRVPGLGPGSSRFESGCSEYPSSSGRNLEPLGLTTPDIRAALHGPWVKRAN